jgi:hypothetical protein
MIYRRGNKLVCGTTQTGKSYSEVFDIIAAAFAGRAIVVLDPHRGSLAFLALQHLIAAGFKSRIIWDSLDELEHTPKYQFLKRSVAQNHLVRTKENHQEAERFAELLCRRRHQQSLSSSPLTEEWTIKAVLFLLNQPHDYPAAHLRFALQYDRREFDRLLKGCTDADIRYEFEKVANGKIKTSQYAAAQRLINAVCESPSFIARCGTAFNLERFLSGGGILLVEGGSVSPLVLQTILGSISLQTIHYVRTRS